MNSSQRGFAGTVGLLVEAGADLNKTGKGGRAALWVASWKGYANVVKQLIKVNADLNIESRFGTALKWAKKKSHFEIIKPLEAAGAKGLHFLISKLGASK